MCYGEKKMDDSFVDKFSVFCEMLKVYGNDLCQKVTYGVSFLSSKLMAMFKVLSHTERIVVEATAESLEGPDFYEHLEICDLINSNAINSTEVVCGIKMRINMKNPKVQHLALILLDTVVGNCEKAFSEVAAEKVLDEMVKLIEDPQTVVSNRNLALDMIKTWGEMRNELRYLPIYEETYMILKLRGILFPGESVASKDLDIDIPVQTKKAFDVARNGIQLLSTVLPSSPQQDELTTTLVQQCHRSQHTIQKIINTTSDEGLMFEALNVNDEVQKTISNYEKLKKPTADVSPPLRSPTSSQTARIQEEQQLDDSDDDLFRDLEEMIYGKKKRDSDNNGDYFPLGPV